MVRFVTCSITARHSFDQGQIIKHELGSEMVKSGVGKTMPRAKMTFGGRTVVSHLFLPQHQNTVRGKGFREY